MLDEGSPTSSPGVLIKREVERRTQGRRTCGNRQRLGDDTTSQEMPRTLSQSWEGAVKAPSFQREHSSANVP